MVSVKNFVFRHFDFHFFFDGNPLDEAASLRSQAMRLCSVTLGLLGLAIAMNIADGNELLVIPLCLVALVAAGGIIWVKGVGDGRPSLFAVSFALMALGGYLLLVRCVPGNGSLFWFLLYPPMLMLCLGLRYGTLLFVIFYFFLLVMFVTPAACFLTEDYSAATRSRFLVAMLGAFAFSWLAEYARIRTYRALVEAIHRLEHDSLTDSLTGLGNRRDFYNSLARIKANALRSGRPFAIAFIDADHFKTVNDRHGHHVGDEVLRHVADLVTEHLRPMDRIFRWGGEEFVILMPGTSLDEARLVGERLRRLVETNPYFHEGSRIPLTISLGVSSGPPESDVQEHVDHADRNLYEAKALGRNQVRG